MLTDVRDLGGSPGLPGRNPTPVGLGISHLCDRKDRLGLILAGVLFLVARRAVHAWVAVTVSDDRGGTAETAGDDLTTLRMHGPALPGPPRGRARQQAGCRPGTAPGGRAPPGSALLS